jgi:hypothetical protein
MRLRHRPPTPAIAIAARLRARGATAGGDLRWMRIPHPSVFSL